MAVDLRTLQTWYETHLDKILGTYFKLLQIPSISTDPSYYLQVRQAADFVQKELLDLGFSVEKWETVKHPVIFASYQIDPTRPTILIYHHYDVQPIDPIKAWDHPPFDPILKDGLIYARGSSDNKGQLMYTLAALQALVFFNALNVNVKLFIEGEEECGSVGSKQILSDKKEKLQADYLLVVDTVIPGLNQPAITTGLRGLLTFEVSCKNANVDLHSGALGGIAVNPNEVLIRVLSQLWDDKGLVAVPGFYAGITPLSAKDKDLLAQDINQSALEEQFGIKHFKADDGQALWESNTLLPTLEINGISGGYAGSGFKTIIPAKAAAKISCRLVPGQDPEQIFLAIQQFLQKRSPHGMQLDFTLDSKALAVRSSASSPLASICIQSYTEVFEKPCKAILSGASIPLVTDLANCLQSDVVMMGMILDSDQMHAPNEHFGLAQLEKGFLTMGTILGHLSR